MSYAIDDTIAAVASAAGSAARGIVRASGPKLLECVANCFIPAAATDWRSLRRPGVIAGHVPLADRRAGGESSTLDLPCDLHLWPTARSYTRAPVAEFHTFGSPPLLAALLQRVCAAGARPAEAGEFTLRAFLAGRIDLTQAEAVLGVIDARDRRQCELALAQLAGGLAHPLAQLRSDLLDLLAELEAGLDFVEEDIQFISAAELQQKLAAAAAQVDRLLEQMSARTQTDDFPRVVLWGWPNTGKSSLFNAMAGNSAALVSDVAGTTRDYVTAALDLDGLRCALIDTAGIEPEARPASLPGAAQRFTAEQRGHAQIRLLCLDATRPLNDWERQAMTDHPDACLVLTKTDQPRATEFSGAAIETSSVSGAGVTSLRQWLRAALAALDHPGAIAQTALRGRESLRLAADCLRRAGQTAALASSEELVAADVRTALGEIGKVAGTVHTDDLLDRIFSRFCIGK